MASEAQSSHEGAGARPRKNPRWLPLESNPDILNEFMERVGVTTSAKFTDVVSLAPELLGMIPEPVLAVCLLFPSKAVRKPRLEQLAGQHVARRAPPSSFFLTQHSEFGNACGTIAAVHAVGNLARGGQIDLQPGSPIDVYLAESAGKDADQLGWDLANATTLHEASEEAAKSKRSQTKTPGRSDKVDGHFVVFVAIEGRLVELDGCMGFPIDHGPAESVLQAAASVIRDQFIALAPNNPNFSVMALCPSEDSGGRGARSSDATSLDDTKVSQLAAMGFDPAAAAAVLASCGGDIDTAVSLLCG
eukprot:CAMPEP_0204309298 /NCGR_PEP_ID=MMETSP0469-20131031/1018_1 /ASSEMBLY_ACC=CAM_ASM_000384 /TAXON_ID=2969 /ORGANISM="Oxyrrhis marina" /LENGTH=303 /DNA_ID=CAMNT_0051288907 /DNA_START=24 /DNA_END=935 /DNA_ORIENTATION=-